jgi:hypothetical protein
MSLTQIVATTSQGVEYNTVPTNRSVEVNYSGGSASKINNTNLMKGVSIDRKNLGVFSSTVIDNDDTDPAISAGVFAYNNQNPIAKKITTELSTVANNVLKSGAAQPTLVRSIHKIEIFRTRQATKAIRENRFNIFTGKYDEGYPLVVSDILSQDKAANPSRAIPGSLNYKSTGPLIANKNYSKKTG